MTRTLLILLAGLAALAVGGQDAKKSNFVPEGGFVPTEAVAVKIAVAVWEPIYGADKIAGEAPYHANLTDGVWTVEGSLPAGSKGGVALAEIAKSDGRILRVIHGK